MEDNMENEQLLEFDTFNLELNGKEIEFAITEEFDFEGKHYILCGEVNGDEINDEEVYLFRAVMEDTEITVESIETEEEYDRIVEAYYEQNVEMETEE
ncbi:MAG: DUF1292 domain-containing protein [Lachnospiraceae bacterium]|nr:DUF1292 domain-containing protein [Lachnospiraceae bacterium]